ncbi:surfeit locus 1 family protein [Methylomarinovum caldicuralii]|uniref:SURF1-like protein n=2 Tax=Methylomarinovum caldicuralii TaxID=438856 RepID=A0AAU9CCU4_9GAMM|nr:surfeit locus 1 family protein [Methylomarinovum caldicuralii]
MVKRRNILFKPSLLMTLLTLVAVVAFLNLGNWQLRRAAEKQALLDLQARRWQQPPLVLDGEETLAQLGRYRHVRVKGVWDGRHQFLLDGRTHQGRAGYEVLTPLLLPSGRIVLVNRGWVPAAADRRTLPDVSLGDHAVTVAGWVDAFPRAGMDLPGMRRLSPGWPSVVQVLEPEAAAARLGRPVADFQIKLDPEAEEGYVRAWELAHIRPERSRGYALQWFSFSAIAVGLWLWHGWKRARRRV